MSRRGTRLGVTWWLSGLPCCLQLRGSPGVGARGPCQQTTAILRHQVQQQEIRGTAWSQRGQDDLQCRAPATTCVAALAGVYLGAARAPALCASPTHEQPSPFALGHLSHVLYGERPCWSSRAVRVPYACRNAQPRGSPSG